MAWVRPLLPAFGITRLANVTGLDRIGIPVWMCIRPNGRALSVSQGKGVTSALAEVSAVMESIELYHAERAAPPDVVASHRVIRRRYPVVNPRCLERGIRWRAYHDAREIAWIWGADVATGEPTLLPHARIDMNWSEPHPDSGLFMVTSSGLASGNTRSEALCHAIFEVVERDADRRWQQSSDRRRRATELDADSIDSPMLRGLLDQFASAGVTARMWDITSRIGIPAFSCLIWDRGPLGRFFPYGGSGCHLSAEIALARALTEAAQSRLTFIAGSRDDLFPSVYRPTTDPTADNGRIRPTRAFQERAAPRLDATFEGDLTTTLQLLADAGFPHVVSVDHMRPQFGIPVVAVVIPGLHEEP